MRFFALIMVSVFLLTGCGISSKTGDISYDQKPVVETRKKPRIPTADDFKASVLDADEKDAKADDTDELLEKIDEDLDRPNITEEDIRRGWYYGSREDMKYGTPSSWVWIQSSADGPKWASPDAFKETDYFDAKELCDETAGAYVISCLDTDISGCEYVPESKCDCSEGSKWYAGQGCILTDENDEFVPVSPDDLKKGWYNGLNSQKKLDTPLSWIWAENGQDSRWQNPSPR